MTANNTIPTDANTIRLLTQPEEIDLVQWQALVDISPVATWFQTAEAYHFFASQPAIMTPFFFAVTENGSLKGGVLGYVTKEANPLRQFLTRRAIIIGGPLLAADISTSALTLLLQAVLRNLHHQAIYVETRNFNDYSPWRPVFERCGFVYQPHLNFHIDTTSIEVVQKNIGKHRWKYIRLSIRDGATLVEHPTLRQVHAFYDILQKLYREKVHTPLFPLSFFETLYALPAARFLLVEHNGNIIGGTVCMCLEGKTLYEWFACGDEHYQKGIRPSSVATWYAISYAAAHGCSRFDFMGAGSPDKEYGVREFKAEYGGTLVEHGRFVRIQHHVLYKIGQLGVALLKSRLWRFYKDK